MEEKIEYTDTINYVVTTQPDLVAGYIDELNERIAELEKELDQANEKLERAIVPKFKIGQKLYRINYDYESDEYDVREFNISNYVIFYNDKLWGYPKGYLLDDEDLFATKEEAEKKIQELRGEE